MLADGAHSHAGRLYVLGGGLKAVTVGMPHSVCGTIEVDYLEATQSHAVCLALLDQDREPMVGPPAEGSTEGKPIEFGPIKIDTGIPAGHPIGFTHEDAPTLTVWKRDGTTVSIRKAMDETAALLARAKAAPVVYPDLQTILWPTSKATSRSAALAGVGVPPPSATPAEPHHSRLQPREDGGKFKRAGLFQRAHVKGGAPVHDSSKFALFR
jgi:hypothetical protein